LGFGGTKLRNKLWLLIAILPSLGLLAASAPKVEFSWRNPNYTGGTFTNILVLALNGKAENRAEFEDDLVAAITRPGGMAAQSYQFLPRPDVTPIDMNDLRAVVREQKFDAVVVARLTKRVMKTTYVPGQVYAPAAYYATFYGYYGAMSPVVYSPGYMQTEKEAQVEVNVYSTAKPDGELVWTGTSNTFEAKSVLKVIRELVKIVTLEMENSNIIDRKST
jgi:hypothetical protein